MARDALTALDTAKNPTDPSAIKLLTVVLFVLPGIAAAARQTATFIATAREATQSLGRRPWETAAIFANAERPVEPTQPNPGCVSAASPSPEHPTQSAFEKAGLLNLAKLFDKATGTAEAPTSEHLQ
jgi:hypothetical protein